MKKRILFSFLIVLMSVASLFAQSTTFPCGFDIVHKQKMLTDRNYDSAVNRLNTRWIKYATLLSSASLTYTSSGYVYEIPMVVHVLHTGGVVGTSYNPDSTKVAQMVAYLNSAYAAVSPFPDTTSGGCRIPLKFVLAKRTPAGVATNGIVRLDASSLSGYSSYGANAATTSGVDPQVIMNFSRWNPADYFNVYCVNKIDGNDLYSTGGIAGFAYFPGYPSLDGMIVAASQVKSGSTTVAHEFGHAFSLYHTFEGDADGTACPATGSCTTTGDLICDTEPHIRESSAYPSTWCPPTGATNSCTGVAYNNVQYNIMDYTTCPPNRFTAGQRTRVLNTLNNERTGFKTSLGLVSPTKSVTSACTPTATTPGYNIGPYIVDFNGMTVWTGDSYSEAATYIDHAYTQQSVVTRGTAYTINVTTMTNKQIVKVFIDYNNDGDFADAGENVFSHSGTIAGTEVHSGSFTIPATATTCSYLRMRVVSDFISASVSDYACGPYVYGQAEDYAIYVKSDTPSATTSFSYCQGATAPALTATGTSLNWYTVATGGTGSSTAPIPNTSAVGATIYYVSQSGDSSVTCESNRTAITVNTLSTPAAPTVTGPVNYCVGATPAALSATKATATDTLYWYNTASGGIGTTVTPTPGTSSAGTTIYYVSAKNTSNCEGPRASITVNVNAAPAAPTVTSPVNYCVGATASALSATGSSLLWYTTSTGGSGLSTSPTPVTTSAGTTTYYVSQTSGGCESPRASITVNVNAVPSAPTVTSPVNYCVGATAAALSATGTSLLWYTTSTGGSGLSTAPTPVTTSAGTTTYYVSQTSGGCESARASITVNVNSTVSAPTVTSPVNYCVGATASALSATGTGLLWYTTPTGGSGISTGPTPVTTSAGATTYYVSQTSGSCESPRAAITVNVNALPTISGTLTACAGVPTTLTGSAAADTTTPWTSSDTTKAKISNTGVVTSIAAGTPTITYKNLNGCTVTATFTVNAMPAGLSVTTPVTYCQDATTSALTTPTGTSIKWYTVATGGTAATTAPTPGSTVPGIIPYYVTQTNASGCENIPRTVINVVINPKPSAVSVTAAVTSFCVGDSVVLNGSSSVFSNFGSTSFLKGTAGTGTPTVCDCPNGSVVVGYEGGVGAWIDHFDMICKPIDRFGTLGTTTTATTANGTSVGPTYVGPYLFSGTGMLVGMKARNESYTPGNFLGEITGYGQNASYIIALGDNTSGATGLTAAGGWSASSDLGTVWAPSGTVVTGMYAYNATAYYAAGVSLRYTPIGAFKYNYSWSSGDTNKNITVKTSGTYTLTVTNSLGCAASSTPLTITANPLPSITGTLNACVGLTSALTGSATPNPTTPWTSSDTTVAKVSNTGVVTGIAAGTATITYKNSNSCNAAVTFTVNGLPGTPTVTTPVTYCQGAASTVLSATKANAADTLYWYTTATGGTGSITAPTPGTAVAGTTLYYVSERNASKCDGSRAVVTVNINPTPIAPVVVSPVTYCQGTTASALNATKGTATDTLLWYTTATGGTSSFLTPTPATGTAGTFTYYVSGKSNAGCEGPRAPITVVINTTPVAPTITTPLVYCQGSTSTALSATKGNAADTLYWYTVATGGTSTTTAPTPSTTTVGSTIFYVSEKTTSNCEGPRAAITVTINTTPSAPAVTSPVNLCVGGSSTPLTATLGTATDSLLWYTVATGGTRSLTAPTPSTASAGTAIYYVSEKTSSNCESPRSAITVNINALPSAPVVSSPVVYCQGATPSALTASGTNLKWYTVATGGTGSTTAPTPSTATAGSTTYYVSQSNAVTAGSCEGPRSAITVTINATPTAPVVTSPVAYCVGSTASALTATKLAITDTIYWYTVATGGTGTTTTPTPSTASAGTTLYYVSLKTNSGCEGPRSAITVNVNALPSAPTVVTPVNLCIGSASSALTATGTNLLWYTAATGGTGSTIAPIPSTSTVSSITYYVSQTTSATGCEGSRAAITVNINPLPSAPTVVTPINLCVGGSSSALAATGTNLLWYTAATGGSGSATAPTPGTASVGSTTYYVTQTSAASVGSCESPRAAITVIVNSLPSAPVVSSPLNLCIGAAASSLAATGLNLKWYTVAAGGTGSTTAPIPLTSSLGTTSYYVSQTSAVGCEGSRATIAVTVQPLPVLTITPVGVPDFVFCDGRKVTLKANAPTAVSYQWQTLGLPIPGAVSDTISTGTKRYYGVTVKDVYGCVKIDSVLVKDDPLPVPTLSPTGVQQCEGVIITLYCKPATTGYTYEWMKDGLPLAVSPSADNTPVTLKGDYTVKVTDIYTCVKTTNVATITNYPAVLKPTITRFGSTLKLDKTYYRYQWYRNNKPIAGATGPIYTMLYDGAYFAAVTDISECGNYSDTVQISSLGVKNTNTNNVSIKLYPNPTKNIINIEAPIKVNVRVTDLVGKIIFEQKDVTSVDLEKFSDGSYFFRISDENDQLISIEKITKMSTER